MTKARNNVDDLLAAGLTAHEAIEMLGFEIVERTAEGETIHCCGQPVSTGSGIFGTDVLTCDECEAQMVMFTSPHVNGGIVLGDEISQRIGNREWHIRPALDRKGAAA